MADIQAMFDAMSTMARSTRSQYHLTLGGAIAFLEACDPLTPVVYDFDGTIGPGEAMSYRGYYADLAFDINDPPNAASFLAACRRALGESFTGYKGGEYIMGADTPLWAAEYGRTGRAIVAITMSPMGERCVVLSTKEAG